MKRGKVDIRLRKIINNIISIVFIIGSITILFKVIENDSLYIGLEILFLFIYSCIMMKQIIKNSVNPLIDIRLYVVIIYMIYNLYTPIVFIFSNSDQILYYGIVYTKLDMLKSLKISIIYFVAFSIPIICCNGIKKDIKNEEIEQAKHWGNLRYKKISFYVWGILWIIAFIWYIYPYIKLGWYNALTYGRWERGMRFGIIKDASGSVGKILSTLFPSYLLIVANLILFRSIAFEKKLKKQRGLLFLLIVFEFIFYLFIEEGRREFMYIIIMIFSYYLYYNYHKINFKTVLKCFFVGLILGGLFISYQYYRNYFPLARQKGITYALEAKRNDDNRNSNIEKWYYSEFGSVYINNLSTVKYTPGLFYGKTYLEAILTPVPIISKVLPEWLDYDKEKTSLITKWQIDIYPEIFTKGGGLGFSPASEAYLNMGYAGCVLFGMIIGWIFNFIYFKLLKTKLIIFYCMLLPQGWNFCRISFTGVTGEVFWFVLCYVLYTLIINIFTQTKRKYISYL